MNSNYSDLINSTVANGLQSIEGRYYFDAVKSGLFQVIESDLVFVEFEYFNGARFNLFRHKISKCRKATKKEYNRFMNCTAKQWQGMKV